MGAVALLGTALDQASVLTEPALPLTLCSDTDTSRLCPPTHDPAHCPERQRAPYTQAGSVAAAPCLAPGLSSAFPRRHWSQGYRVVGAPRGFSSQLGTFLTPGWGVMIGGEL